MKLSNNNSYVIIDGKKVPLIQGGKGGCFAANTLISTPSGYSFIQDLNINDEVISFNSEGNLSTNKIIETFTHNTHPLIDIYFWGCSATPLRITPNHWVLNEHNTFSEIGKMQIDDVLICTDGTLLPITDIKIVDNEKVYNLTIENDHTFIANNIRVHNKGGDKSSTTIVSGTESPNNLFSTDILFITVALGEGPLYRINPNGPQDIEINDASIDDLLNLDSDGSINEDFFHTQTTTGTITQKPLLVFGESSVVPQSMSRPVLLKKGNIPGIPRSAVTLQSTSPFRMDEIEFIFSLNALQKLTKAGDVVAHTTTLKVTLFDFLGITEIRTVERRIEGKTNIPVRFTIRIIIPEEHQSSSGHKFTVEKLDDDTDSAKKAEDSLFIGWLEIIRAQQAYPRTALIGYGIKAEGSHTGQVPTFTCMAKGLLCKVPNNYDQPIITGVTGTEIDWRQLEVSDIGSNGYPTRGYRLQSTGDVLQNTINPVLYKGLWDGGFTISWTQNPVWIIYDLLTNKTYGLAIPEDRIDKFRFYKVAQYCDGVDFKTGKWFGVDSYSDGTNRYKPNNTFTSIREILVGLSAGISIKERRFICDISIGVQKQVMDLVILISGLFRGVLFYSGGKISLNVDLPDDLPVAIFNETNIAKDSFAISGINESDILTSVEVAYLEPTNHYKRELIRIEDDLALREQNEIENIHSIELSGVTRRSQATRFGQYLLASSKYIRRLVKFKTSIEAINLTVGDVIAISQRVSGPQWGYGGRVLQDGTLSNANVILEHFTHPAITDSIITGNTNPLALRILKQENDQIDLYLVSNTTFSSNSSGNTQVGIDTLRLEVISVFNPGTKTFVSTSTPFTSDSLPKRKDLWTFGEVNPDNFYTSLSDRLFKITNLERDDKDEFLSIEASEYISNVYIDSDKIINYVPSKNEDTFSPLIPPPAPNIELTPRLIRRSDGSVETCLFIDIDTKDYPLLLSVDIQLGSTEKSTDIIPIIEIETFGWDVAFAGNSIANVSSNTVFGSAIHFSPDGLKIFIGDAGGTGVTNPGLGKVRQHNLSNAWDLTTMNTAAANTFSLDDVQGIGFDNTGSNIFLCTLAAGGPGNDIFRYPLSAPYTLSSIGAVHSTANDLAPKSFFIKPDGNAYFTGISAIGGIFEQEMPTPWDLNSIDAPTEGFFDLYSPIIYEVNPRGLYFKDDGSRIYIVGPTDNKVYQFTLSNSWSLDSGNNALGPEATFNVASETGNVEIQDMYFSPDGKKLFLINRLNQTINYYPVISTTELPPV